jgi:hypothetical protein
MYREALALSVHRHRPGLEVRLAPPTESEQEILSFRPHLLLRNDNDEVDPEVLEMVTHWIEVLYTDSMNVRISAHGRVSEVTDISMDELFVVVSETEEFISRA